MSTPSPRVLLLAYYFPRATGIASERMVGFHRYLPAAGWDPLVVAPRNPHFHQASGRNGEDPPSVIRTGSLELSRLLRCGLGEPAGSSTVTPVSTLGPARALRGVVREFLYVPDAQIGWVPFAVRAGARALERDREGDWVVFSSSVPYSAHLAAARLASRFRLPWVAEFRDPWSAQDESQLPRSSFRRKLDRRLEEWILQRADGIVVTADRTREIILEHFPGTAPEKVVVIPNGFDPRPPAEMPGPGDPMTIVHAGTLHAPEYALPFLRAAASVEREKPGSLLFLGLGDPAPWLEAIQSLELFDLPWIVLRGNVLSEEAQEVIWRGSVLLLPAPHPRFRLILLGKLFSYLGARRPILGVVPPGSEMEALIRQAGDGRLVPEWDEEGIRRQLEALLEDHRAGRLQHLRVPEDRVAPFTRETRSIALARFLDEVLERGSRC